MQHIYIEYLHDEDIGFITLTTHQILAYIWAIYGDIGDYMMGGQHRYNEDSLFTTYTYRNDVHPTESMPKIATEDNDPIIDAQDIRTGVQIVGNNGLFNLACHEFHTKLFASRTLTGFKIPFRK